MCRRQPTGRTPGASGPSQTSHSIARCGSTIFGEATRLAAHSNLSRCGGAVARVVVLAWVVLDRDVGKPAALGHSGVTWDDRAGDQRARRKPAEASLAFYRDTLGFEVRLDVGGGKMRWITVGRCCPGCPTSRRGRPTRPFRLRLPARRRRLSRPDHWSRRGLRRSSTDFFACIQWTWWPGRYDLQDRSIARISPKAIALLLNAEPPLAEIPKDAEHASQSFERLASGLFKTHQITEGSTLG